MREQIIELLKNREAGIVENISISADEIDVFYHIDYNEIANYIMCSHS